MCRIGDAPAEEPDSGQEHPHRAVDSAFAALLEDSTEDLYENAPCGYLSTLLDGTIVKINTTLLSWLGHRREDLVGHRRFTDLLTMGGKLYHETHYAPLLTMQGEVREIALDLVTADRQRMPALVNSVVKTGSDGHPLLIRTTVFDARDRRAYERELLRARQEAEREGERLQRLTSTLQRTLLPPALPQVPGLATAVYYRAASTDEVGGDFYDLFPLGSGTWGFFLGDVCGKGPEAAVMTSVARYTLRAAAVEHADDPVATLTTLNTVLRQERGEGLPRFCTVLVGRLLPTDEGRFSITIAGGGHPPALVIKSTGAVHPIGLPGGQLVGILPSPRFSAAEVHLEPGDILLLYSDGLTEARLPDGELLGEDRLIELITTSPPSDAATLVTTLSDYLDSLGTGLCDDVALLAFNVPVDHESG